MKNWFLVAVLAFVGLTGSLYASPPDPGGVVGASAVPTITLDQTFSAALGAPLPDLGAAAFALQADQIAVKEAVKTVAALAVSSLVALLLAVLVAPYLLNSPRRTAYDGPSSLPLEKLTTSNVLRSPAQAGSPVDNSLGTLANTSPVGKRTKSPLLKSQSA